MRHTVNRSCESGKFVKAGYVKTHKATTETELVPEKKLPHTMYRSCVSGEFVTKKYADGHPKTCVELKAR